MIHPVHHIPGRLRIKSPLIKGKPHAAEALRGRIGAITGVVSVEISSLTGSAVIEYCRNTVTGLGILHKLDELRYGPGQEVSVAPQVVAPEAGMLSDKFMAGVAQALVERSAVALVAALV